MDTLKSFGLIFSNSDDAIGFFSLVAINLPKNNQNINYFIA